MTEEGLHLANAQLSGSVPQHNGSVNFAEKKVVEYSYEIKQIVKWAKDMKNPEFTSDQSSNLLYT
jgi:hypothetical protein